MQDAVAIPVRVISELSWLFSIYFAVVKKGAETGRWKRWGRKEVLEGSGSG